MTLRAFTIDSYILSAGKHCRLDPKYTSFTQINKWVVFKTNLRQVPLAELIQEIPIKKYKKGDLGEESYLVNVSDQEQRSGDLENITLTDKIGSDKNYLGDADIFISKLGMPKGYVFLNPYKGKKILGSTEFIPYKIKDATFSIYLKYLLIHNKMLKAYESLESGKTPSHKRVNPYEFLKIKVPLLSTTQLNQVTKEIIPIEKKIKELKSQIKDPQEVINRVFAREFGFNIERFEELKKVKIFNIDFSAFGNNKDLRNSVKFHRQAGQFVLGELTEITSKKIKDFIAEPIILGKGISPAQYDDNGEYYYLSMATIKNWKFEKENARLVTDKFANDNQNKTIQINDIILARSGEGTIGKCAIIDNEDLKGVFADFTMRIRLADYNPLFAYYYFRTEYFQYLVEINKKGLGNNTNIFPSQIQEFPIIDISLKKKKKIVDEIKAEIDKQEEIRQKIEKERKKIDEIIEKAIA